MAVKGRPGSPDVQLDEEMTERLAASLRELFRGEFERELSEFQARRVLEFTLQILGPPVYNRAVVDAAAYMTEAVTDMEAILHAGEPSDFRKP